MVRWENLAEPCRARTGPKCLLGGEKGEKLLGINMPCLTLLSVILMIKKKRRNMGQWFCPVV
jgi:hypothetical protein